MGSGNNGATNNSVKLQSFFSFLAQSDIKVQQSLMILLKSLEKIYLNKRLGLSNTLLHNFPFQHELDPFFSNIMIIKAGFYGRKLTACLILSSGQGNIMSNILAIMTKVIEFKI